MRMIVEDGIMTARIDSTMTAIGNKGTWRWEDAGMPYPDGVPAGQIFEEWVTESKCQ